MTSQPSDTPASAPTGPAGTPGGTAPADPAEKSARQFTEPLRQPAAFVLLLVNGLILLFAVLDMLVIFQDWSGNFVERAGGAFVDFVGLVSIGFPLLAVLLATHVKPRVPQARLITVLALVEYGVSALFGALCLLVDFLHGVTGSHTVLGISAARRGFEDLLIRAGEFGLLAIAALAVFQLFQGLYAPAAPAAPYGGGYPPAYGQQAYPAGFQPYGQQPAGYGTQQSAWAAQQAYAQQAYAQQANAQQAYAPPAAGQPPAAPEPPQSSPEPPQSSPEPAAHSGPGPVADENTQPTRPIRPPVGPDGPTEQWTRPQG
ncbi:MAG TPA: hypothetical protein VGP31_12680 [Planosporangium sp.]|nr:hypothetical protein [Planosporangium sp.]